MTPFIQKKIDDEGIKIVHAFSPIQINKVILESLGGRFRSWTTNKVDLFDVTLVCEDGPKSVTYFQRTYSLAAPNLTFRCELFSPIYI